MELKFYYCEDCDNVVIMLRDSGVPMTCCGQPMIELVPGGLDGSQGRHTPVYQVEGNRVMVTVGTMEHPMIETDFIEWIVLQTKQGFTQRKMLSPNHPPKAVFAISEEDAVEAVYIYCSVHGLWKA